MTSSVPSYSAARHRSRYGSGLISAFSGVPLLLVLSLALALGYGYAFWDGVRGLWFNPHVTSDDALQQLYQFHEVHNPGIFAGDYITQVMTGYLAPLHYWISYLVTYFTGDPIMMGHWVMLLQFGLALCFLFLAVRSAAGVVPALFAVTWLIHTRHVVQRMTAGLPRGWAPPILAAFLYFALAGNHWGVLITLLLGCLLNPPVTLIAALAYGILLLWRYWSGEDRARARRQLISYLLLGPLYVLVVFLVIRRPEDVGQMVNLEMASQMPEFSRQGGRFPFLPLLPAWEEIKLFAFQAFRSRWHNPGPLLNALFPWLVLGITAFLAVAGVRRGKQIVPAPIWCFGMAALFVYLLSRPLAFYLYVPNRHLQIPMALFFISALSVGVWQLLYQSGGRLLGDRVQADSSLGRAWRSALGLVLLGGLVVLGSGSGLQGPANFNHTDNRHGGIWQWLKTRTPASSLVAGHPTHIDGVALYGMRRAYITTETAHPFYLGYLAEVKRRLDITFRAYYAQDLAQIVQLLEPEGVTHLVFRRSDFRPESLAKASYFRPLDQLVAALASKPAESYVYKQLPRELDLARFPFVPYLDALSVVIDVQALKRHLESAAVSAGS